MLEIWSRRAVFERKLGGCSAGKGMYALHEDKRAIATIPVDWAIFLKQYTNPKRGDLDLHLVPPLYVSFFTSYLLECPVAPSDYAVSITHVAVLNHDDLSLNLHRASILLNRVTDENHRQTRKVLLYLLSAALAAICAHETMNIRSI